MREDHRYDVRAACISLAVCLLPLAAAGADPPPEVEGVLIDPTSTLSWDPVSAADVYHVYRGLGSEFLRGAPPRCHGTRLTETSFASPQEPDAGEAYVYLVTAASDAEGEGTPGHETGGAERALLGGCEPVMRHHILDRIGYGWSEWHRDRLSALGWQGYVDEQLAPETIDESGNTLLSARLNRWSDPETFQELVYLRQDRSLYTWRQLEQQTTEFWQNHFTTYYLKTYEYLLGPYLGNSEHAQRATNGVHRREEDSFREQAFGGTFRDIVGASTLSAAMMIYLDNVVNVAGIPNENYARELLELHTMGVDGGYQQADVEELARVFTGWEVCKKAEYAAGPLDPCLDPFMGSGIWVANFNVANHDSGQKALFAGTPHETIIPDTSATPEDGYNDVDLALDGIVAHPSTSRFISTKLLRRFITDDPTPEMVDAVVAAWETYGGDLREVLRAVLAPEYLFDPDYVGAKMKTPQEHQYSAFRALRGKTELIFVNYNNSFLYNWLAAMDHLPYFRVAPDGYPEVGPPWIGTNALLSRQDMGMGFAFDAGIYRTEVTQMVAEYSLSTAEEIVDFFADILYGGALTPAERERAIDYLNTDASGAPSPYDDNRIREAVGFMLGYAQFNER